MTPHLDLIIDKLIEKISDHRTAAKENSHLDSIYAAHLTVALLLSDIVDIFINVRLEEAHEGILEK